MFISDSLAVKFSEVQPFLVFIDLRRKRIAIDFSEERESQPKIE